jgi:hypothetical protein
VSPPPLLGLRLVRPQPATRVRATLAHTASAQGGPRRIQMGRRLGFGKPPLESRAKAEARLDLEVSAGWVNPSSRGLWGGDALLLSTDANKTLGYNPSAANGRTSWRGTPGPSPIAPRQSVSGRRPWPASPPRSASLPLPPLASAPPTVHRQSSQCSSLPCATLRSTLRHACSRRRRCHVELSRPVHRGPSEASRTRATQHTAHAPASTAASRVAVVARLDVAEPLFHQADKQPATDTLPVRV